MLFTQLAWLNYGTKSYMLVMFSEKKFIVNFCEWAKLSFCSVKKQQNKLLAKLKLFLNKLNGSLKEKIYFIFFL